MIHYILQTIIFQLLFLMVYDVFLKKETFFNWNRFYLLSSAFLSIVLPFVKISSFKQIIPQEYIFKLPEVVIGTPNKEILATQAYENNAVTVSQMVFNWHYIIYLGCAIALVLFVIKLINVLVLVYRNPKVKFGNTLLVELINSNAAFSFFNYIFLGSNIETEEKNIILAHEVEHVKQKHSLDLLFFEVLRILFWFNPLVYIYQKRIAILHEFIADSKAIKINDKKSYYENLLAQVFDTKKVSFINPFFKQSLIKKRIIMLSKTKSKQINLVKHLLLIPMVVGMLFYTSCEAQEKIDNQTNVSSKLNEDELLDQYIEEIRYFKDTNDAFFKGHSEELKPYDSAFINDNYVQTLDEYVRFKAFFIVLHENRLAEREENADITENMLFKLKSSNYKEYLTGKETQKSIEQWENTPRSLQLRKHVKDLDNITGQEQLLIDSKIKQIESDEFYNTLIISDGLRHKNIEVKKQGKYIKSVNVNNSDAFETEEVSFATIEQVPIYPGCDGSVNEKECMSKNINKFVAQNFNLTLGKELGLVGTQKIQTFFTINKEGDIVNIKIRAPHPELEKEARRIIKMIPKMKAGEQDGKPVSVVFFLPISFNIQE